MIDPEQSLELIRETKDFADEFKIGRWNHDPEADKIDWKAFAGDAVALCQKLGKQYYIKRDLAVFLK